NLLQVLLGAVDALPLKELLGLVQDGLGHALAEVLHGLGLEPGAGLGVALLPALAVDLVELSLLRRSGRQEPPLWSSHHVPQDGVDGPPHVLPENEIEGDLEVAL